MGGGSSDGLMSLDAISGREAGTFGTGGMSSTDFGATARGVAEVGDVMTGASVKGLPFAILLKDRGLVMVLVCGFPGRNGKTYGGGT